MFFSIEKNVRKSANTVLVNAGKNNCHGFVWVQTNEPFMKHEGRRRSFVQALLTTLALWAGGYTS
jgi:hypothetical protein